MATYYLPSEDGWSEDYGASYRMRLKIVQSYSIETNKSTLTVTLQTKSTGVLGSFYMLNNSLLKAGSTELISKTGNGSSFNSYHFENWNNNWNDMQGHDPFSYTVTHNADGTASVVFTVDIGVKYESTYRAFRGNKTTTLSLSEVRRSTIASCSSSADTLANIALSMNRTGNLYHKAKVLDGSTVLTTTGAFATSTTISVPRSWFNSHPSATSFSVTVSVQSYTDSSCSTAVGSPDTKTVTIRADSGMKPVLQSGYATAAPYNTGSAAAGINKFVSGYSKAEITLNSAKLDMSAAAGATVSSIEVTGGGVTDTSSPYRTGVLRDTATVTVKVTDSRGRYATQTLTVVCCSYAVPRLSNVTVIRCDSAGNESEDGTYYAVTATLTISSIDGENSAVLTANNNAISSGVRSILGGSLQPDQSYTVTILGEDELGNRATVIITLPGRKWAMRFRTDGEGVGFGKSPEIGSAIEIPENWNIYIGSHRVFGKTVQLNARTTISVQLEPRTQYFVVPEYGPWWRVQTRRADQTPLVYLAFSDPENNNISVTAGDNCTITLQDTHESVGYRISIMLI